MFDSSLLLSIPALVVSFTFHEYAHAKAADWLGDPTPRYAGRLTLNPAAHLDPIGLLMLWFFRFGWAKPVPFNPYLLRNRRYGEMIVALAGPLTNLALAFFALLIYHTGIASFNDSLQEIVFLLIIYNVSLAVFNLLPIPPLDGSHVLKGILSGRQSVAYAQLESYGMGILLLLLWTGIIGRILQPLIGIVLNSLDTVAGLLLRAFGL